MLCFLAHHSIVESTLDKFHADLAKDLTILKRVYTTIHPGFNRYSSDRQMNESLERLGMQFARAANLKEAFRSLTEFTASVRCGHTFPNFSNQSEAVLTAICAGSNRLPFLFRWIDGKMVVTEDLTARQALPRGSAVSAIDGVPTQRILGTLRKSSRSDGGNDFKRIANLELRGLDRYEPFDVYFPLYFKVGFKVDLAGRSPTGKRLRLSVDCLTDADRKARIENRSKEASAEDPWKVRTVAPGIKALVMDNWVMYKSKWDWEAFLEKFFQGLAADKTKGLIVDIRGNEGGSSVGDVVFAYLTPRAIKVPGYRQYTRYRTLRADLKPYLDTWDRSFDDWTKWTTPKPVKLFGKDYYRMTRWDDGAAGVLQPKSPTFKGKVVVLVDSTNSSATFEFASLIRTTKRGQLIGEPTGGNQRGINGSAFYFLNLPNSKLEVDVPLVASIGDLEAPDAGLMPDIFVRPGAQDFAANRDVVLSRAIHELEGR